MKKAYMLGIDIGSGGCKVTIVDNSGEVAATAFKEYPTDYPHPGWAEQHPDKWHEALQQTLNEAVANDEKARACEIAQNAGADSVKTSTGFSTGGATPEDVILMRKAVGPRMGVKASGGNKDFETAAAMIAVGATRIGAGAGVAIVGGAQ